MTTHEGFMREAVREASRALGRTHPNPPVGCVIVRNGEIVARGHHKKAGGPHAEVHALRDLTFPGEECSLYVTLEPCCSHGRTPPCSDAILKSGIRNVFVGVTDPDARHNGGSVSLLREQGVEVTTGVAQEECVELIRAFSKHVTTGIPWVSAKWAMTLDGKIASASGISSWISSAGSRQRGHELRDTHDAILVGKNTLVLDDPTLTCRIPGGRDPVRVVIDARLEGALDLKAYDPSTTTGASVVWTSSRADTSARQALEARGVEVVELGVDPQGRLDLEEGLRGLGERGLLSVLVEGGGGVLGSMFDAGLVDRVYGFVAPRVLGGLEAPTPVAGAGWASPQEGLMLERVRWEAIEQDLLMTADVPRARLRHPGPVWS